MDFRLKRRAGAAWVLAACLLLAACDSPEERAEKHMQRGLALLEQGDSVKARLEFRNVLKIDRDDARARFELGRISERTGDLRGALGHYRRVVEADENHLEARLKLAQLMLLGGAVDESMVHADAAYALAPESAEVLSTRAAVLYRTGDEEGATAAARAAVEKDSGAVSAQLVLLTQIEKTEGPAAAERATDALLEKMPEDPSLNMLKLRLTGLSGDVAAVEAQLRRMVDLFPEQTALRRTLAQSYLARGALDDAEREMRALAAANPNNTDATLDVVRMIYASKGAEAAKAEIEALIAGAADADAAMPFRLAASDLALREADTAGARATLEAAVASGASRSETNRARLKLARLALGAGERDTAESQVATVLEGDPDNVDALTVRASLAIDDLDLDAAILDLRRAQNLAPENPALLLMEAQAHERDGDLALVAERLAAAARVSDFEPRYAIPYARFLRRQGQGVAAEAALAESARRNPEDRDVLTALAEARLFLGDAPGADEVAARLRTLEGGDDRAERITAAALAQSGRLSEGIDVLERLVGTDDEEGALGALVSAYVQNGETDRAEALLDELIERNPTNLRALALRAELHLRDNRIDDTEATLKRMVTAAPESASGYMLLGRLYGLLGRAEDAEAILREGVATARQIQELQLSLAVVLEQRGNIDEAITLYKSLFESQPQSVVIANNYASLLADFRADEPGAIERAAAVARRLRESQVPQFQDTYGWVAFLRGDAEEALRYLAPASEALPANALVHYHIGRVYAAIGDAPKARHHLEAALSVDPAFPKANSAREAIASLSAVD